MRLLTFGYQLCFLPRLDGKLISGFVITLVAFGLWNLYYLPVVLDYSPESYFKLGFWDSKRLITLMTGMLGAWLDLNHWSYVPLIFWRVRL